MFSTRAQDPALEKVKYKQFKNGVEEEQTTEILIPPTTREQTSLEIERRRKHLLNMLLNPISIFILIIIFIVTYSALYSYTVENGKKYPVQYENASNNGLSKTDPNTDSNITHPPFQKFNKLILTIDPNFAPYSCTDNKTCHSLLHKIEEVDDVSQYNFIIGSEGELYVGSGFKSPFNGNESTLYIKVFVSEYLYDDDYKILFEYNFNTCLRIYEIIENGILCGSISKNYHLIVKEIDNSEEEMTLLTDICAMDETKTNRSLHFHNPNPRMNVLIHRDIKWTTCGNFSHNVELERNNQVITLQSFSSTSCSPLQKVNEILIDILETPRLNCSNDSCLSNFEEQHDGLKYNFIIGHNFDVYVGRGFRCLADNRTSNIMKIKVLEPPNSAHIFYGEKERKFVQILNEGIVCGKILEQFTVKANCNFSAPEINLRSCKSRYEVFTNKNRVEFYLNSYFGLYNEKDYSINSEHGRGIVPYKFRLKACENTQLQAFTQESTTII